jgi:hypothetical protein
MSDRNVDLIRTLIPQVADITPLFRSEPAFAQVREALAPVLTDDFENVVFLPAHTRTVGGLRRPGRGPPFLGRATRPLTRLRRWRYYAGACGRHARR